tara:strand:- start:11080 stop:11583 length:504 start_codon:yes stop_codon:yes gene_type:complete
MSSIYKKYILLLPLYVIIQIMILNQILFFSYINPYLYIILIISLPLKISSIFLFIYSFILGFCIDIFSISIGYHSSACVLVAFFKNTIQKLTIPNNILNDDDEITLKKTGNQAYIIFTFILILSHHTCLFFLEHFEVNFKIIFKILLSTIASIIIIYITQLLLQSKK